MPLSWDVPVLAFHFRHKMKKWEDSQSLGCGLRTLSDKLAGHELPIREMNQGPQTAPGHTGHFRVSALSLSSFSLALPGPSC